jgi:hypothetical protein
MAYWYPTRPQLLDENAICKAIRDQGLTCESRNQIISALTDNFVVDLDSLAQAMGRMEPVAKAHAPLADVA